MYYLNLHTLLKNMKFLKLFFTTFLLIISLITLNSCGMYKKVDQRQMPDGAEAKARKNIEEGKGVSIGGLIGKRGGGATNYEFSTSNPIWRASLETLDFLPLITVDYSGGMIITDWYSDDTNNLKSLKITVRFLSNEIRTDSLKIIVHQKNCSSAGACSINLLEDSKIKEELYSVILKKAVLFEKEKKK